MSINLMFATYAVTFSYFWLAWFVAFIIIEGVALSLAKYEKTPEDDNGGTLSEVIWRVTKENKIVFILFTLFWIVLGFHFFIQ